MADATIVIAETNASVQITSNNSATISVTETTAEITSSNVGIQGASGATGATGPANVLSVGTVTGGATASATITGTTPAQVLNLVLPKGDKGDQGIQGITGATGAQGIQGIQGIQGLKGDTGNTGETGPQGASGDSSTHYAYNARTNTTSGDPTANQLGWNNSTQISSTALRVNHLDADGIDDSVFLDLISLNDILIIQDKNNAANYQTWEVSGTPTYNATWDLFPVTLVNSAGTGTTNFASNHPLLLIIISVGNVGPQGPTGATGAQGPAGATGAQGIQGIQGIQGASGVVNVTAPITNSGTSSAATIGIDQTALTIAQSQVTSLTTDLAAKAITAGKLSQFATTTSTELAGVISGKTGTDFLVFSTSPTFNGTVNLPTTTSIGDVSSTEIGYLNNVTSSIQTQLDSKLSSQVPAYPPFTSGAFYKSAFHGSGTTVSASSNTTHYTAIFVGATTSFDRIGTLTGVMTSAGTVRLGIYSDSNGSPGSRVLDAGTVAFSASSTSYLITINQSLTAGWYWLAFNMQSGSSNFLGFQTATQPQGNQRMFSATVNTTVNGFTQASVTGAFPATATPVANASSTALNLAYLRAT